MLAQQTNPTQTPALDRLIEAVISNPTLLTYIAIGVGIGMGFRILSALGIKERTEDKETKNNTETQLMKEALELIIELNKAREELEKYQDSEK